MSAADILGIKYCQYCCEPPTYPGGEIEKCHGCGLYLCGDCVAPEDHGCHACDPEVVAMLGLPEEQEETP